MQGYKIYILPAIAALLMVSYAVLGPRLVDSMSSPEAVEANNPPPPQSLADLQALVGQRSLDVSDVEPFRAPIEAAVATCSYTGTIDAVVIGSPHGGRVERVNTPDDACVRKALLKLRLPPIEVTGRAAITLER